jgi:hypothetical protein
MTVFSSILAADAVFLRVDATGEEESGQWSAKCRRIQRSRICRCPQAQQPAVSRLGFEAVERPHLEQHVERSSQRCVPICRRRMAAYTDLGGT